MLNNFIRFFLENRLVAYLLLLLFIGLGLVTAPFDFGINELPRDAVAVDAIPDIGENQQIVFTKWMGRSPQDVEDQITYPLTTALLGLPEVKSIRSNSMFGFSSINTGAEWLSSAKEIRNPYFGDKMMSCGVVKTTIDATFKNSPFPKATNTRQNIHNH